MGLSRPAWELALRAILVYLGVLFLLRLAGKRHLGQMSPTEFVAILLISNAVQNAMNGGDTSLAGGMVLAAVLILMSWLISVLTYRHKAMRVLFEGTPTLLIHRGQPVEAHLARERLNHHELRALLRKQGVHAFEEVQTAILEADGTLSVTRISDVQVHRTA